MKRLNSLVVGQLFGGVLFLIGVVLAAWSYNNDQLMGQLFGGALILIGIVLATLAYNKRKRFIGTHGKGSPEAMRPAQLAELFWIDRLYSLSIVSQPSTRVQFTCEFTRALLCRFFQIDRCVESKKSQLGNYWL